MRLYTILDFIFTLLHCDIKLSLFLVLNAGLHILHFFKLQLNCLFEFNFQSFSCHNACDYALAGLRHKNHMVRSGKIPSFDL